MANQPRHSGPLNPDDIKQALQHNGFPFEVRLLKTLEEAKLDPTLGFRFMLSQDESKEVDLIARFLEVLKNDQGLQVGMVDFSALIEAKSYAEHMSFIGIKWTKPDAHALRSMRLRIAGQPSCMVHPSIEHQQELIQLMLGQPHCVASALDPLSEPPYCVNWVKAHPPKENRPHKVEVDKDQKDWESFKRLARLKVHLDHQSAELHAKLWQDHPPVRLSMYLPVVVISTPHLYLYDALENTLEPTASLSFIEHYEVDGRVAPMHFDVVTEAGLGGLIERYRRAVKGLRDLCEPHLATLQDVARQQKLTPPPVKTPTATKPPKPKPSGKNARQKTRTPSL